MGPLGLSAVDGIGASDCELLRDGALAQPVNAWTSFAYVVAGLVVIGWSVRRRVDVAFSTTYGILLAAVGIGSVLFHGPQPDGSRWFHDTPITLTLLVIVAHDATLLAGRRDRRTLAVAVALIAGLTVSTISLDAGTVLTGLTLVAIVTLEALIARRGLRTLGRRLGLRSFVVAVAIGAVAATAYALGRTGAPTCAPRSIVQLHGLWHIVTASAFGAWWWLAIGRGRPNTP